MVNNPYYSFPTKDAINFATDSTGTVVNPNKVKASQDEVLSNSASEHEVRGDAQEGVGVADKPEQTGKSALSIIELQVIGEKAQVMLQKLSLMY